MSYGSRLEQGNDEQQQCAGSALHQESASRKMADSDRGCIRVLEDGLQSKLDGTLQNGKNPSEQEVSEWLIAIAKENGLFIEPETFDSFGEKLGFKTGECLVYINSSARLVFKVKDPFAKRTLKDLNPANILYEHIIHNLLFPNTHYQFLGVSEDHGLLKLVLSQPFIEASFYPTQEQIENFFATMGLLLENRYYYGNEYLSVTDVSSNSDNVLMGEDGMLYFIDPIIKMKKPPLEIIEYLSNRDGGHAASSSWFRTLFRNLFGK